MLLGIFMALLMLQLPACAWVSAAILSATLSRWLVATGAVPNVINFVHCPLALGAACIAASRGASQVALARSVVTGCIVLLAVSFISWIFSSGEFLRPLLNWLVFAEPFFIIYALIGNPPTLSQTKALWGLALAIPAIQLPFGLWQALTLGLSDYVQGTFVGLGAGHHVAGGVALAGTLICVAKGLATPVLRRRLVWLCAGALLVAVPVLSDAKQNIVAFLPALGLLMFMFQVRLTGLVVAVPILTAAIVVSFTLYEPLQMMTQSSTIHRGFLAKTHGVLIIADKLSDNAAGWPFGLGPGNSISRVALMGMDKYLKADSPVATLGLSAAPTTQEIWTMGANASEEWLFSGSSVWTGISSWSALLGDLGLVGLGLYLWMSWKVWRHLQGSDRWPVAAAKSSLVMAGLLGGLYSWLEEPGFTLLAALIAGLGLMASHNREATSE